MRGWIRSGTGRGAGIGAAIGGWVLLAPGPVWGAFERPPQTAGSAACGGLLALSEDVGFGNPASAATPGVAAEFGAARPFGLRELSEGQAGVRWAPGSAGSSGSAGASAPSRWGIAFGGRRFGTSYYAEKEGRLSIATQPDRAALGVALVAREVSGEGLAPRRSVGLDAGFRAEPFPGLVLGAFVESVLGEVPGDPGGRSRRTALGFSRRFGTWVLHTEAQRVGSGTLGAVVGLSVQVSPALEISVGAREDPGTLSWGARIAVGGASVSVAGTWRPPLGTSILVGIRLGAPKFSSG